MAEFKTYDAKIDKSLSDDSLQVIVLDINYSTNQLQAGVDLKQLKGTCRIQVNEDSVILTGFFQLDKLTAVDSWKDKASDKWINNPVTLDSEKACAIVFPKEKSNRKIVDFPVYKLIFEKLTTLGEILFLSMSFNTVNYNDYYRSVMKLHEDPEDNMPDEDWLTLTTPKEKSKRPAIITIEEPDPELKAKIIALKAVEVSTNKKGGYGSGETTTKKLSSRLEFLEANSDKIIKLNSEKFPEIPANEFLEIIMTL